MTRRIIVWRHGRTAWNLAGRVQGQSDVPLDDVGRQQARDAAARLASLKPAVIVSSDLSRARDTAEELGRLCGLDVVIDERLRERRFGEREGLTLAEAWEQFPDEMGRWLDGSGSGMPGSESGSDAGGRFVAAVHDHLMRLGPDETLVVVSHGGVIRIGTLMFLGLPSSSWDSFLGLSNCAWNVIEESTATKDQPSWRLTEWNTGTLPEPVLSDEEPG